MTAVMWYIRMIPPKQCMQHPTRNMRKPMRTKTLTNKKGETYALLQKMYDAGYTARYYL